LTAVGRRQTKNLKEREGTLKKLLFLLLMMAIATIVATGAVASDIDMVAATPETTALICEINAPLPLALVCEMQGGQSTLALMHGIDITVMALRCVNRPVLLAYIVDINNSPPAAVLASELYYRPRMAGTLTQEPLPSFCLAPLCLGEQLIILDT